MLQTWNVNKLRVFMKIATSLLEFSVGRLRKINVFHEAKVETFCIAQFLIQSFRSDRKLHLHQHPIESLLSSYEDSLFHCLGFRKEPNTNMCAPNFCSSNEHV